MFKTIARQAGLEILEYGLIAALIVGGGTAAYVALADKSDDNTAIATKCLTNPKDSACKSPGS